MNDVCSVMSVPLEPNRLVIELLSRKRGVTALLTSPFNSKVGCSLNKIKKIASLKQPLFLLNGEVIWQAGDSSLTKELHASAFKVSEYILTRQDKPKSIGLSLQPQHEEIIQCDQMLENKVAQVFSEVVATCA